MKSSKQFKLVIAGSIVFGILTAFLSQLIFSGPPRGPDLIQDLITVKVLFTSINIFLFTALTVKYFQIYSDMSTDMSRSLAILNLALLLYALTSSPIFHALFGFQGPPQIGPFTFIPDMFAAVAAVLFLRESYR